MTDITPNEVKTVSLTQDEISALAKGLRDLNVLVFPGKKSDGEPTGHFDVVVNWAEPQENILADGTTVSFKTQRFSISCNARVYRPTVALLKDSTGRVILSSGGAKQFLRDSDKTGRLLPFAAQVMATLLSNEADERYYVETTIDLCVAIADRSVKGGLSGSRTYEKAKPLTLAQLKDLAKAKGNTKVPAAIEPREPSEAQILAARGDKARGEL